jgi:hypothetical protein
MATLTGSRPGRVILDSGGVSAMAGGDPQARATLVRARREGRLIAIPAPVLVEVCTGKPDHARVDRVVNAVESVLDTTADRARQAGALRARTNVLDVVDAIVVAEAVAAMPAVIVTSDPADIRALVDAAGATRRVGIVAV